MLFPHSKHSWRPQFEKLVAAMQARPIWQSMTETVENSPWHREANVAVHTTMVTDWAISYANVYFLNDQDAKRVVLAAFFHDFGKPAAEQEKTNEETGEVYRTYYGHEKLSARWFEDLYVDEYDGLFKDWVTPEDAHAITFLIEHHLPYKITDKQKKIAYAEALTNMFEQRCAFYAMLRADTWGRISDGQDEKKAALGTWIDEFEQFAVEYVDRGGYWTGAKTEHEPTVVFLVGPSGAGKSTASQYYQLTGYRHYSWDDLRIECYMKWHREYNTALANSSVEEKFFLAVPTDNKQLYRDAFKYCSENEQAFTKFYTDRFRELLDAKVNVVVDNTNLTRKRRAHLLQMAKQKKYRTVAVYKQTSLNLLLARSHSRVDKQVPTEVIVGQFNSVEVPFVGEFDEVVIDKGNFVS